MTVTAPGLSAPPVPVAERWRRIPRRWQVVIVVVALLVVGELASSLVSGLGGSGSGASGPSSSYDTSPVGTAAFVQLLTERGYATRRITAPLSGAALAPRATLFVLDPVSFKAADTAALATALARGTRVVLGGPPPAGVLRALLGAGPLPVWQAQPSGLARPVGGSGLTGVSSVDGSIPGSYVAGSARGHGHRPLLAGSRGVLAIGATGGRLVLLGSSGPIQNQAIAAADDAALALDLAGPAGTAVAFDEYDHGVGRPGTGLAGLPARWRWGLGIALLALLVWLLSAARRFGPPAPQERQMIPPRVQFVDALATVLATRPPEQLGDVLTPVQEEVRRLASARGEPDPLPDDAPASGPRIMALGRALARLERSAAR